MELIYLISRVFFWLGLFLNFLSHYASGEMMPLIKYYYQENIKGLSDDTTRIIVITTNL